MHALQVRQRIDLLSCEGSTGMLQGAQESPQQGTELSICTVNLWYVLISTRRKVTALAVGFKKASTSISSARHSKLRWVAMFLNLSVIHLDVSSQFYRSLILLVSEFSERDHSFLLTLHCSTTLCSLTRPVGQEPKKVRTGSFRAGVSAGLHSR